MEFLTQEQKIYPQLLSRYQKLQELFLSKLYHELTEELLQFVRDPECRKTDPEPNLPRLYQEFIRLFQQRINTIKLVIICTEISSQYQEPSQSQSFLESVLGELDEKASEAKLLCQMAINRLKFHRGPTFHEEVKNFLETNQPVVEGLVGAEPVVHASYYRIACDYYGVVGPAEKFYKNALMFLAYTDEEVMPEKEKFEIAQNLSIAAISGTGVFHFGEVLATPILKALDGTPKQWLSDLLRVFNRGDIDKYNEIISQHSEEYFAQPAFVSKSDYIKEKLALLALMRLIFERASNDRNVSFTEIATVTRLGLEQVEWLIMRSLSCGLIKGSIDQVDALFRITWVQPRVLDTSQLSALSCRMEEWEKKVYSTLLYVEEQTPELFQ
uniref:26S proteasome nonATPase regulatory subunit 13 putat n=1 Tax=Albugo laibachii Nc14 TaxID=890382 RepID=F0W4Z9_9STRA|nr:26S proteasome nonATPase regulatory subunit 13 putat [Albugo laibachii Nc14]|eukprot:CCA16189.1 26S proteasome nonATPase regulatory subunit 13 putat [Albugo laibachii Nc14]